MSTFRFASRGLIPYCLKLSTPLKISRLNWHIGGKRKPGKSTGSKEIFLGGCVHSKVTMCVHLIIASSCYSSPCMPWFWCRKKEALEADLWLKGTSGSQSPVSRWRSNTTRRGNGWAGQQEKEYEDGGEIEEQEVWDENNKLRGCHFTLPVWKDLVSQGIEKCILAPCPIWKMTLIKW